MIAGLILAAGGILPPALSPPQGSKAEMVEAIGRLSAAYPPSAGNSPTAFAWGLFGALVVTMMSVATILRVARLLKRHPMRRDAPGTIFLMQIAMLALTIFLGASGDVLVSGFWNEVQPSTMAVLMTVDKIGDGMVWIPFMVGTFMAMILRGQRKRLAKRMKGEDPHDLRVALDSITTPQGYLEDVRQLWDDGRNALYLALACATASGIIAWVKWIDALRWMGKA